MLDELKGYVTGIAVRWVLKIAGGAILQYGISADNITAIITAVVAIVFGILISLFQQKKAVNQEPVL